MKNCWHWRISDDEDRHHIFMCGLAIFTTCKNVKIQNGIVADFAFSFSSNLHCKNSNAKICTMSNDI